MYLQTADSIDIPASDKFIKEDEKQVKKDVNNVHNWFIGNKLNVNVIKTKYYICND